jgi:hypothetical protein
MAKGFKSGGRGKGSPNKTTVATRARIERDADPIGFLTKIQKGEVIKAAVIKEGDISVDVAPTLDQRMTAAKILADKMVPNARSALVKLKLPTIENADDVLKALAAILQQVAAGELRPDEAATLSSVLESHRRAIETVDIEQRLTDLERMNAQV